jgi:hypothetical protein
MLILRLEFFLVEKTLFMKKISLKFLKIFFRSNQSIYRDEEWCEQKNNDSKKND